MNRPAKTCPTVVPTAAACRTTSESAVCSDSRPRSIRSLSCASERPIGPVCSQSWTCPTPSATSRLSCSNWPATWRLTSVSRLPITTSPPSTTTRAAIRRRTPTRSRASTTGAASAVVSSAIASGTVTSRKKPSSTRTWDRNAPTSSNASDQAARTTTIGGTPRAVARVGAGASSSYDPASAASRGGCRRQEAPVGAPWRSSRPVHAVRSRDRTRSCHPARVITSR